MTREYIQYTVWNGLACRCRCTWPAEAQYWFFHQFVDLMGHGPVEVHYQVPDDSALTEYELNIRVNDDFSIHLNSKIIYLSIPCRHLIGTEIVHCLLTDIYQYEHKKMGLLSLHSGACRCNNKTLLLAGESGAGKTTLLLNGKKNINGFEILSNDYVVIRPGIKTTLVCTDASSSISVRKDISYWQEDGGEESEFTGSENRRYYVWQEFGIQNPLPIDTILIPELVDSCEKLIIRKMSREETFYRLYYSTMALDSGLQLMLFDDTGELLCAAPHLLNETLVDNTRRLIQLLTMHTPIIHITGTIGQILSFIEEGFNESAN